MFTKEENEILTRVSAGTPMGDMLREYWHPVLRSERLVADGAPVRVRLLGEDFVAFRSTDGRVGFFDEKCPHRCASLGLARNEDNGLRCIFHGWKFDVSGICIDVPTEPPENREAFAKSVPLRSYSVREAGNVVWACLTPKGMEPRFPDFEFQELPDDQIDIGIAVMRCNWVQGMESVLDSAHLGFLHRGQLTRQLADKTTAEMVSTNYGNAANATSPVLEVEPTSYGFREGALRELADGRIFVKLREFVAPYYAFLPLTPEMLTRRILCISVPIDDEHCAQWFIYYNLDDPFTQDELDDRWFGAEADKNNFYGDGGNIENMWHQDRQAMKQGHFSGFPDRHIFHEDFIVQEAMGPITDRTREFLSISDKVIIFTRKKLVAAAKKHAAGGKAWGLEADDFSYSQIRSCSAFIGGDEDWRKLDARELLRKSIAAE